MFIDETGEANVLKPDPRYNLFSLCGVIFREDHYKAFDADMNDLKEKIFGRTDVILHSFTMRNKEGAFKIFKDDEILGRFYIEFQRIVNAHEYYIVSAIVNKPLYKERYPERNFAYEGSLEFLCERAFFIKKRVKDCSKLHICLEDRDKSKNRLVKKYYNSLLQQGNAYYSAKEFSFCHPILHFKKKTENINGLQFADLCAYPIVRAITNPDRVQPTFEVIKHKIYCSLSGNMAGFGVKVFPA